MIESWQRAGFGIYVHWPFCAAKCPYCDFNSHVVASIDQDRFLRAYLSELDYWAAQTEGRVVSTVFFGGGTPSLMEPSVTAGILDGIATRWPMANDLEVTLEANPTSVEAYRFDGFRSAGITRFSIGFQSLREDDLRRLGRLHSVSEGRRAVEVAQATGARVSFDLIYARQDQTVDAWRSELTEALALEPDHLSLYQLTIEPGTAFWSRAEAGGLHGLPDEDRAVALWEVTQEMCEAAGFPRYEVSNHARPGEACRHNLIYWRGGDWLGVGPGAHGRVEFDGTRRATANLRAPGAWLESVDRHGSGLESDLGLAPEEVIDERVLMGLRLSEGLPADVLRRVDGLTSDDPLDGLIADGLLARSGDRVRATDRGVLLLDYVIGRLRSV